MERYFKTALWTLALVLTTSLAFAQDGEGLFKAKCNACHLVDKNSTGPVLTGVKQKWIDAGEGEMIYEWVKGPEALIASGKSKMAAATETFIESMVPDIGIIMFCVAASRQANVSPVASEPTTKAVACVKSFS